MSAQQIKIGEIEFSSGNSKSLTDFVNTNVYQDLHLFLDLSVTISGGTTSGTLVSDGEFKILKNLYLSLGGQVIKQIDGMGLKIKNLVQDKKTPFSQPLTSDTAGSYSVQASLEWNFEAEYLKDELVYFDDGIPVAQKDLTCLYPRGQNLQLKVDWGTIADLVTGGDRTRTITGKLIVFARIRDDLDITKLELITRDTDIEETNVSANSDKRFKLPDGGQIQRVYIKVNNDNVLNNIRVYVNDSNLIYDYKASALKAQNKRDFGVDLPSGWYLIDFNETERINDGLDSTEYTKVQVSLDIANTTDVELYVDDIVGYP